MSTTLLPSSCYCQENSSCHCLPLIAEDEIIILPTCECVRYWRGYQKLRKSRIYKDALEEVFFPNVHLSAEGELSWNLSWEVYSMYSKQFPYWGNEDAVSDKIIKDIIRPLDMALKSIRGCSSEVRPLGMAVHPAQDFSIDFDGMRYRTEIVKGQLEDCGISISTEIKCFIKLKLIVHISPLP